MWGGVFFIFMNCCSFPIYSWVIWCMLIHSNCWFGWIVYLTSVWNITVCLLWWFGSFFFLYSWIIWCMLTLSRCFLDEWCITMWLCCLEELVFCEWMWCCMLYELDVCGWCEYYVFLEDKVQNLDTRFSMKKLGFWDWFQTNFYNMKFAEIWLLIFYVTDYL